MIAVFFFKQKTAYEMRISDWSSDVCSSDLISGSSRGSVSQRDRRENGPIEVGRSLLPTAAPRQLLVFRSARRSRGSESRSEERRVGQECVSPCRSRWSSSHYNKKRRNTCNCQHTPMAKR